MEENGKTDALDGFLSRAVMEEKSRFLLCVYNSECRSAGIIGDGYCGSLSCTVPDIVGRVGRILSLPNIDLYVEDIKDGSMSRIKFNYEASSILRAKIGIALRCPSYRLVMFTYKDKSLPMMTDFAENAKNAFGRMDADDYVILPEQDIQDLMDDIRSSDIKAYRYGTETERENELEYRSLSFGMKEREFLLGSLFPNDSKSKHRGSSSGHERKVSKEIGKRRKKNRNRKTHRRHK